MSPQLRVPQHRSSLTDAHFRTPPMTDRPGIRWWWQAPNSSNELVRELRAIHDAGFGEVEIAFSAGFWADEPQRTALRDVLKAASELGMGVQMTMGAAWPLQTPNTSVGTEFAAKELQYGVGRVGAGELLTALPAAFDDPERARASRLFAVVAARVLRQGGTPQIVPSGLPFGHPTKIVAPEMSTILDAESFTVLTDRWDGGQLDWAPPGDDWAVFAFWERDAAQGVTSFLDARAARAACQYLDAYQLGDVTDELAGVATALFEDSLELNAESLFWSPDLATRFEARHGYDLTPWLPVLFAQGMCCYWVPDEEPVADFDTADDRGARVRRDYYRLLTDLYVSDHLQLLQEWAVGHGVRHKAQAAYGQNLEPVRSFRELVRCGGWAEAESLNAGDRVPVRREHPNWRFALDWQRHVVAGAHQGGASRVSTELGAQMGASFDYSLADYRHLLDREWAVGITKPFVHGFATQPADAPWPTLSRFWNIVSESWNDKFFPEWCHWGALNDYWARGTAVLETGRAVTDVAVYRDGFLTTAARGRPEEDYQAPARLADLEAMEDAGFSVHFIDPIGVSEWKPSDGDHLFREGPDYQALVMDARHLPMDVARTLDAATEAGLRVVLVGDLPSASTGWGGRDFNEEVATTMQRLLTRPSVRRVAAMCEATDALHALGVEPRVHWTSEGSPARLLTQLRLADEGRYVVVYNTEDDGRRVRLSVEGDGAVSRLELDSGDILSLLSSSERGRTSVDLDVPALGLVALRVGASAGRELSVPERSQRLAIADWSLVVTPASAGEVRIIDLPGQGPADWREIAALMDVSGIGVYRVRVTVPEGVPTRHVVLEFGRLAGSAVVRAGGATFGPALGSGSRIDLGDALPADGWIEIEVRTTLRNAALAIHAVPAGPWNLPVRDSPHGLIEAPVVKTLM